MFSRAPLRLGPSFGSFRTTLIARAKLNAVDSQVWLADVLRRIANHAAARPYELLPWRWQLPAK
jgi:hypothetical protein